MARATRSAAAKNGAALDKVKTPAIAASQTPATLPKRRGRPPKAATVGSDSVSSAPTPTTTISDSEYSTPATSNAVTPAPSVPVKPALSKSKPRARLVVELPDNPRGSHNTGETSTGFNSLSSSRARRARRQPKSYVEDSEDDDFDDHDQSPSAVLARRLQREEYEMAGVTCSAAPAHRLRAQEDRQAAMAVGAELVRRFRREGDESHAVFPYPPNPPAPPATKSSPTKRRSARISAVSIDLTADDSEDDPLPSARSKAKSKGKTVGNFVRAVKWKRARPDSFNLDEEEEPLARPAPVRKRLRTAISDSEEEDMALAQLLVPDEPASDSDASFATESDDSDADSDAGLDTSDNQVVASRAGPVGVVPPLSYYESLGNGRAKKERAKLEHYHPELKTMWKELEEMPLLKAGKAEQPSAISRQLKPFQLEGLAWMKAMEGMEWKGGLLGDEMGLGKTIQAVSLIMSDYPAKAPSLVLVPPVALMQWTAEIDSYTNGKLKTFIFHGTNAKAKNISVKELKGFDVILMSYNSLESMYRKQEKGFKRKEGTYKEKSAVHQIKFHRVILDEAHCIKTRTTMTAKACFALKVEYRWCLTGTPLQNRIGEFFSLIRFLNITPFASYLCKKCTCSCLEWSMADGRCTYCSHNSIGHVSVFNQELLNPIQACGNSGHGKEAFKKLRLMTDRIMLRRLKKDHTDSMELPVKEIYVDRQFFGEEENDFANSIMTSGQRKFDTYVAQGVLLNNYANIFGLIMQMRQVADHPDLLLKKSAEGGQNILVCCICDEPAEEAIRSKCKHDFCRSCAKSYVNSQDEPDCPQCHIPLSIDLEQPEMEQDEALVKKSSIINRIKMENWTSSSKIELLVHSLHRLRSDKASHKSIIFSQFTTMLQLIEWRLRRAGLTTVMLDGSMTPAQRQATINHFMTNVDVECFLVSLKAGGVALNLTEATHVFIVDPWWNPAAEWQSADRCHRIGQTRPCTITRLCIEDSVESRMVLLQEKKTDMINSTINSDDAAMESLTQADLQFLFRGT
ncbi:SNF2 family N-terminal domain-containing protein [Whalleya microplaca]|nr:SNF2 family N-terminal domain-containing protein [Whalleya microplaca]